MLYRSIPVILAVLLGLIIKGQAQPSESEERGSVSQESACVVQASLLDELQKQSQTQEVLPADNLSVVVRHLLQQSGNDDRVSLTDF